jgi:hypothetical protein
MPHIPETTNPDDWHRYFAMESNNRAWELASKPSRTASEECEMLTRAHASAHHWAAVGKDLNITRAKYLVAEVHALAGSAHIAERLAGEVLEFFDPETTDDWEMAYVYTIQAHALARAGDDAARKTSYERARSAVESIKDPEDKRIVEQTFSQVPPP